MTFCLPICRSTCALPDEAETTAMTRIICRIGPRAKRLRAANEKAPPKVTSGILSLRSPNRLWRTRRKSALFPQCCRIATFFVSSRCGLTARCLATCAQEDFCFPTILTTRTLSVTIVTSLDFIFFISDIRNVDTFDRVVRLLVASCPVRHLSICAKYLLFETCSLCRATLSGASRARVF
jgi:hypothetical protein